MKRLLIIFLALIGLLLFTGVALGMGSGQYDLAWFHPLTGSGGPVSSTAMDMDFTLGQSATGVSSSSHFQVELGYWPGITAKRYLHIPLLYNIPAL